MRTNANESEELAPAREHTDTGRSHAGFTLVELLVVMGTVGLLAAILLPAIAGTKPDGQAFQCLNNTKRLTAAWLMYADDNNNLLMNADYWVGAGVRMDWTGGAGNYNTNALIDPGQALIANYVRSASLFKCPADNYQGGATTKLRVRSYSLNGAFGATSLAAAQSPQYPSGRIYPFRGAATLLQLRNPGPANTWAILDEHPDSINDGDFKFNAGYLPSSYQWRDMPASYHSGACGISFADGHSDIHKWLETGRKQGALPVQSTVLPVTYQPFPKGVSGGVAPLPSPQSQDYAWMNDGMPYNY
jgi:prepilin-type N-terminal cleavage/methylation domain-containing protein/prepilin-type processing-associated H-X9-DG protein